jgi:hypothetical protein
MIQNFKIEFNPQIQDDIQQQVDYYKKETKSHELGKRFGIKQYIGGEP